MDKQLRLAGADRVMLGTDYAFDMGMSAPVDFIHGAGPAPRHRQRGNRQSFYAVSGDVQSAGTGLEVSTPAATAYEFAAK